MQFALRFEQQRSKRCKPHERSRSSERDYARYGDRMSSGRASGADAGGGRVVARASQAGVSRG
jgi:hypothetical protein